jgi:glycopeptide antibiotics resistance protein
LIILLSIITILVQFTAYYFFEAFYVIWGISSLISILCCHVLLEQSVVYESCFGYSLLTLFISLIIIIITYFGKVETFLPYTVSMLGIAAINWLIPMLHCFLRYMLNYGTRVEGYEDFYRNLSSVFLFFYLVFLIYTAFIKGAFAWAYPGNAETYNFTPFGIIATQVEDYLYGDIPIQDILTYLFSRILPFAPYGFYITLLLRRQNRLTKFFAMLVLPFIIEVLQYILIPSRCDIDDLIYALIGGLIGSLLFLLMNLIFRAFSGKDFLASENDYRFSNSLLHF